MNCESREKGEKEGEMSKVEHKVEWGRGELITTLNSIDQVDVY